MDDMQRMIERYKRELMEMSKFAPKVTPIEDKPNETIGDIFPEQAGEIGASPRVVGYVPEKTPDVSEKISEAVGDKFSGIIGMDEIFQTPSDTEDMYFPEELPEESEQEEQIPAGREMPEMPEMPQNPASETPENPPTERDDTPTIGGSRSEPADFPEPVYDSYDEFIARNRGAGTIRFSVYTASEALPVAGAKCVVTKVIGGEPHTFYTMFTDISGRTTSSSLPAPSKELSQNSENKIQPFSLYDAVISKEGYAVVNLRDIPVFDGVLSIQQVQMIPVPNGNIEENITEVQNANS